MDQRINILVLNAGSSSQKLALYQMSRNNTDREQATVIWRAHIDYTREDGHAVIHTEHGNTTHETTESTPDHKGILTRLLRSLTASPNPIIEKPEAIHVVGHRIVHGGPTYSAPSFVDDAVKGAIRDFAPLAPSHNPVQLDGIEVVEQVLGDRPQVAVFDTAFHQQMPDYAATYPIPLAWHARGIRRYGFHGISHQYCTQRAAACLGVPTETLSLVTCHLGNGCSLAAVQDGVSIDTTMGMTPLEGVMMATRSGSIDPTVPLYLVREHAMDIDEVLAMLNHASGLKGISGLSGDIRTICAAVKHGDPHATLALDMYVHRIRKAIGSMVAVLGGADALVFTAGVGEHNPGIRKRICDGLACMGIDLSADRNASAHAGDDIATAESPTRILVVHTDEDWLIARECAALV